MTWNKEKDVFYLAVGHGKQLNGVWDCGCVYGKYNEADLMLPIAKEAMKWLRKSGIRVLTDADKGNNRNMTKTVEEANASKVTRYMSVHCDYKYQKPGVAPIYRSAEGKKMAVTVGKYVAKQMGMKWRGAFKATNLFETNATNMPAVIFETGAIKADLKYLKDYKKYGKVLAKGICKYLGVAFYVSPRQQRINKFRAKCDDIYTYMLKHNFAYKASYKDNAMDWAGAKKKKSSNCSDAVSYALQESGFLKPGQIFWCNGDKISYRGEGSKSKLAKVAEIKHPHKSPKKIALKKGDICGYKNNPHTQVFAGYNKDGNPTWYSWSTADKKAKKFPRRKKSYDNKEICTLIRLK